MRNEGPFVQTIWCLILLALVCPTAFSEDSILMEGVRQIMDEHEVETSERAPDRIQQLKEPRFSFVQVADAHHQEGGSKKNQWLPRAVSYINDELQPAFVVFSGDNISGDTEDHQKRFQSIIQSSLDVSVHLIRGDNDEEHFHEVFGSSKWTFDFGGLHFMGTAIDVDEAPGKGTGYFSTDTIDWMKQDLKRNEKPTVVFLHQTIWPPTFTDAPRLAHLLRADSDVLFLATGHLHRDLEVSVNGLTQIVAPSVRMSANHGIKEYRVYQEKLVIVTHEIREKSYTPAPKYQEVAIEPSLQVETAPSEKRRTGHLPPQEMRYSKTLGWYRRSVESRVMKELLRKLWIDGKHE